MLCHAVLGTLNRKKIGAGKESTQCGCDSGPPPLVVTEKQINFTCRTVKSMGSYAWLVGIL